MSSYCHWHGTAESLQPRLCKILSKILRVSVNQYTHLGMYHIILQLKHTFLKNAMRVEMKSELVSPESVEEDGE